jgi:hypothetical protein
MKYIFMKIMCLTFRPVYILLSIYIYNNLLSPIFFGLAPTFHLVEIVRNEGFELYWENNRCLDAGGVIAPLLGIWNFLVYPLSNNQSILTPNLLLFGTEYFGVSDDEILL